MESEWTRLAFVKDASSAIDEVKAVRPSRVGLFGYILKSVNHRRELDAKFANATIRNRSALFEIARAGEDNVVLHVALHLPYVAGVRFEDVHGVERYIAAVFFIQCIEGGNLPPERRSSVAAEHEDDRFLSTE